MDMRIVINGARVNKNDQTVYFTITADDIEYQYHADIPKKLDGDERQGYLNAHLNHYFCDILRKQYPDVIIEQQLGEVLIDSWQRMIASGDLGESIPFEGTHAVQNDTRIVWL